jgi:DNA polymerase III delta prime subunit
MTAKLQEGLRDFMEGFSANCGFILTANHINKITDALQSRCPPVSFKVPKAERPKIAATFFARVEHILNDQGVPYDKKVLAEVVQRFFPDFRKTLNVLQRYSRTGSVDVGILSAGASTENVTTLVKFLRDKNFTDMRKWIASAIIVLADYQYKEAFVANSEINRVAAMVSLMAECSWRE